MLQQIINFLALSDAELTLILFGGKIFSALTMIAIAYTVFRTQQVSYLQRNNEGNQNDLRIELAKRHARRCASVSSFLSFASAAVYFVFARHDVTAIFAALGALNLISLLYLRPDEKLLAQALSAKESRKLKPSIKKENNPTIEANCDHSLILPKAPDLFNIAEDLFAQQQFKPKPVIDETDAPDSYRMQKQIQFEHEREKADREKASVNILDSEYIN